MRDIYGPMVFDVEGHYVTENIALKHLQEETNQLLGRWNKLEMIAKKYPDQDHIPYPLEVCLNYYREVGEILQELVQSEEILAFQNGKSYQEVEHENKLLRFELYWKKKKWKYIWHLLAVIPFLALCISLLYHKAIGDQTGNASTWLTASVGLITIAFTIIFNNHNSFKDSFKLLTKRTANELKETAKKSYLQ